jgi:hypothetical protein
MSKFSLVIFLFKFLTRGAVNENKNIGVQNCSSEVIKFKKNWFYLRKTGINSSISLMAGILPKNYGIKLFKRCIGSPYPWTIEHGRLEKEND